jgi:predicted ATPase/DNA-binding winged helix-turn-helix (wHTH) protein
MESPSAASSYSFGRYRADIARRALFVDGAPVRLGARAFDVLTALIERRERLVSKSELLDVAWPHAVVDENNLQVQISALRKLLGPDVIATIPGRGYKFTALLEGDRQAPAEPAMQSAASLPPAARTNLPTQLAPLYGREADVQAVNRQLQGHRLVTIAGAGGIGKTRVGQAVAQTLREAFPDGVWLIELAPLAEASLVAATVAQMLGHQLRSTHAPLDELVALLGSQRLLLLVDNCEHLVDAVSQLAQVLLDGAPAVHLLVTSQEPLRLPQERLYRLGTLGVPGEGARASVEQALECGAVRLFVERAHALDPRFALDKHNLQAVIDICRELDGLALAIEMAAARVPVLGVQGVRERLGERMRMLTAGSRIALRRHQTLRAALDWSHSLLEEPDQIVFRRLGVFSGGCSIEAAQQVASDHQIDEWAVLDAIGRLVDKSLIVADGDERPRYRMLESARAYALERLAQVGETDALARRHAGWLAAYAERIGNELFDAGGTEDGFIAARAAEFDNFRAALKWTLGDAGDAGIALQLLGYASPLAFLAASRAECEAWLTALNQRVANMELSPMQSALRCAAEISWGYLTAWHQRVGVDVHGRWPLVRQTLQPLGDRWIAYCACIRALLAGWRGDIGAAREMHDEVHRLERPQWPAWLPAYRLYNIVRVSHLAGQFAPEVRELPAMLARLRREGDGEGRAAFTTGLFLAEDCLLRGGIEEAAQRLLELAELGRRQRRDSIRMMELFRTLVLALSELGRLDQAREVAVEALPLMRWFGWRGNYAPILALLAARSGRLDRAARVLAAGEGYRARIGGRLTLVGRYAEERVRDLLTARYCDAQLSTWSIEGAAMSDEDFDQLVYTPPHEPLSGPLACGVGGQ